MVLDHANREPVSTYGSAVAWLFTHSHPEEWAFDAETDLPLEARLVCDMFWITPDKLIRDIRKLWNQTLAPSPSYAPLRRGRKPGWR